MSVVLVAMAGSSILFQARSCTDEASLAETVWLSASLKQILYALENTAILIWKNKSERRGK